MRLRFLTLVAALIAPALLALGLPAAHAAPANAPAANRIGVVATGNPIAVGRLGVTWYLTYGPGGSVPAGMHRAVVVRLTPPPDTNALLTAVRANPGSGWIIGNEPNGTTPATSDALMPAQYATALHDLAAAIRAADATALIVGPSVLNWGDTCTGCGGFQSGLAWTQQFYTAYTTAYGTRPPLDRWAEHTYELDWSHTPAVNPAFDLRQLGGLRSYLDSLPAEKGRPIWVTEMGVTWAYPGWTVGAGQLQPVGAFDTLGVNNWLAAMVGGITDSADLGVERAFLYAQAPAPDPGEGAYGGISLLADNTATAAPTPAGQVLAALIHGAAPAALAGPAPGSRLPGNSGRFGWSAGSGIGSVWLDAGTQYPGSKDVYSAAQGQATGVTISGIPTGGGTLFVRLWSKIAGNWLYDDATYGESGKPQPAAMTGPATGTLLTGSVQFQWDAGKGVAAYELWAGDQGPMSKNLYARYQFQNTTGTVTGIPQHGGGLYLTLWSLINDQWQHTTAFYVEAGAAQQASLTSPSAAASLTGPSATFLWSPGTGATWYYLRVGTAYRGSDIYNAWQGQNTNATVSALPTGGRTLYVTLWSLIAGAWQPADYTFREAP